MERKFTMTQPLEGYSNNQTTPGVKGSSSGDGQGWVGVLGVVSSFVGDNPDGYGVVGTVTASTPGGLHGGTATLPISSSGFPGSPAGPPALPAGAGVYGYDQWTDGPGVCGGAAAGDGVYGFTGDPNHAGVHGANTGGGNGVYGTTDSPNNSGVVGTNTGTGIGVYGTSTNGHGIYGITADSNHSGVQGINTGAGTGIYGKSQTGNAGWFDGNVQVNGTLTGQTITDLTNRIAALEQQVAKLTTHYHIMTPGGPTTEPISKGWINMLSVKNYMNGVAGFEYGDMLMEMISGKETTVDMSPTQTGPPEYA
jgi:hypothetical protein